MSKEDSITVLKKCSNGSLACLGDDDYPYSVPLSYVYFNDKIYFHSAKAGHKIDAVKKHKKVSFSVIGEDTIVSEEYTTYFRSVIVFGKARIVEGDEWLEAFKALVEKYSKDQSEEDKQKVITGCTKSYIIAIDIEDLKGKTAKEYVQASDI